MSEGEFNICNFVLCQFISLVAFVHCMFICIVKYYTGQIF